MIERAMTIANGKGGVGKTSLTANLAGLAAMSDWRVLAIDLDPQGNLGSDFGYKQTGHSDDGAALASAVLYDMPIQVIKSVRPGLDVIPAGDYTRQLAETLTLRRAEDPSAVTAIGKVLQPVSNPYDLIIIDGPPAGGILVDSALAMSQFVLIPVKADEGSLDGLELIARTFGEVSAGFNPRLELLGVALFDFAIASSAVRTAVRKTLEHELGGIAPVFKSVVRSSQRSAYDMRRWGLLAHEYHERAEQALAAARIKERIDQLRLGQAVERFSRAAAGLADDYAGLALEVLDRFALKLSDVALPA